MCECTVRPQPSITPVARPDRLKPQAASALLGTTIMIGNTPKLVRLPTSQLGPRWTFPDVVDLHLLVGGLTDKVATREEKHIVNAFTDQSIQGPLIKILQYADESTDLSASACGAVFILLDQITDAMVRAALTSYTSVPPYNEQWHKWIWLAVYNWEFIQCRDRHERGSPESALEWWLVRGSTVRRVRS